MKTLNLPFLGSKPIKKVSSSTILIVSLVSLTTVVGYRFYNQPQLAVGTVSPITIESPRDGTFEDIKTTEETRKEIRNGVIPVLKHNDVVTGEIKATLNLYLSELDNYRRTLQRLPMIDSQIISTASQRYLHHCNNQQWSDILLYINSNPTSNDITGLSFCQMNVAPVVADNAIKQLKNYHLRSGNSSGYAQLIKVIDLARMQNNIALQKLPESLIHSEELLGVSDTRWKETEKAIREAANRMLIQGIVAGLPSDIINESVYINLINRTPKETLLLASELLNTVLKPNLIKDDEATKLRAEQAAQAVPPVLIGIKKGAVIVKEKETINQATFTILDGLGLSRRGVNWHGLGLSILLVSGGITVVALVAYKTQKRIRCRDLLLLYILSISAPLLGVFYLQYTALVAIALLVSSFYNSRLAVVQILCLAGLVGFASGGVAWELLLSSTVGSLVAAALGGKLRSREEMAILGCVIGLVQGMAYMLINLIMSATAGAIWYVVLPGALLYGLSGVACVVLALGLSPYLERVFDVVTPIRLAELSNPNLPLLKRLAIEAPGTFQHTMFVTSLAEAAARELQCNVELVRAGTLYHDIGKLHDPQGFIENQMGGENKHDFINDPYKSAQIIKKHVSEGLVMARKYGLPKAIRDFIPEHQGTLLISYFYFQAKMQATKEGSGKIVAEEDFRYDGPIPQSREAGIMMLADGCEAALRSLNMHKDTNLEEGYAMVQKIFKARWRDQQLKDSGLEYHELEIIARVFVQVWQQYNHKRIAYPPGALEAGSRGLKQPQS